MTQSMIGGMTTMTTIKVPTPVRDRLREAAAPGETQAVTLGRALDALERAELLAELAAWEPDQEYLAEMHEWDRADLGTIAG